MNADDRREHVAALTRQGHSANSIADRLHINPRTVSRDRAVTGARPPGQRQTVEPPRRDPHIRAWTKPGDMRWTADAACRATHQDFTPDLKPSTPVLIALRRTCETCPVIAECAAFALNHHLHGGVYAGVWLPHQHSPICLHARELLHRKTKGTG